MHTASFFLQTHNNHEKTNPNSIINIYIHLLWNIPFLRTETAGNSKTKRSGRFERNSKHSDVYHFTATGYHWILFLEKCDEKTERGISERYFIM